MSTIAAQTATRFIEEDSMAFTRLYIEHPLQTNTEFELSGDKARYVGRVLRLRPDDQLTLFDGRGGEYRSNIRSITKSRVVLSVDEHIDRNLESPLSIHLLQGVSRGERMDLIVQKATELGVHRITPLITEYSVVRLDAKRAEKRVQHWRGIAASACEQCGRNMLPLVDAPIPLRNWLGENFNAAGIRMIMRPGASHSLKSVHRGPDAITLLIGPEGGFGENEYELAEATGFMAIGFGSRILRTETAAIAVLAALQAMFGDLALS